LRKSDYNYPMVDNTDLIDWLLEPDEPSVRYRTMTELQDHPATDPAVRAALQAVHSSPQVDAILSQMHPEGYWLQTNPRSGEVNGKGVEYGAFATTHYCLAYLAELGMDRSNALVARSADRYLGLQKEDGDFWNHFSCLLCQNIRTFLLLGYRDDPRLQKSIDLMLNTVREDGGYLCDMHDKKYKTKEAKSCVRGAVKALLAFAHLPEYRDHPRCRDLIEYFVRRNGIFTNGDHTKLVNRDVSMTVFPIHYRAGIVEVLYALSRLGFGNRREFDNTWELLKTKRDDVGKYVLDWTPVQSPLKAGKRGRANKWITLYALLAEKYRSLSN
jgi:hypothetical protein